jgi:transglutaminase-like putative cysteine protease
MFSSEIAGSNAVTSVPLRTAILRYLDVCLYLLVVTGFITLAGTGGLDLPTVVLVGLAMFVRGYFLAIGHPVLIPENWTTYLTLTYVAFYAADYFLVSRSFLAATVHLVLFGMVVRLFSARRERDYYMLAILAFLMVLAAAVLTVDSVFLFAFAAFMLMAVATFVLMEIRHSAESATIQARESVDGRAYRRMAFSLAGAAPLLSASILAGASIIFFFLPRVSSRYLTAYASTNEVSTGFTDRVQLGRIGQIQQSSAVVMHIQIEGDAHGAYDLRWRGVALSLFDGKVWSNPAEHAVAPRLPDGSFLLIPRRRPGEPAADQPAPARLRMIRYRVVMEPVGSNVFFLAPKAGTLQGNYRMVTVDQAGAVYDLDAERPVSSYEAVSNIAVPTPEQLRSAPASYPARILLDDLQLPRVDPRISQLAQQITASAANNYDKAAAMERYLAANYGYTLELPSTPPADPLVNFLFERKRGHCEYFASAMTIMLRTLGMPARVVNGFRTGEFNDLTSNYVVRASNAHSWVEAYFPGYGWISFDPTPAAPPPAQTAWNRAMLYVDAMASFWREWVINYDATHQKSLGQEAARGSRSLVENMHAWARRHYFALLESARYTQGRMSRAPWRWALGGLSLAVLLLLAVNLRRIWMALRSRRLRAHPERAPRSAATLWYQQMMTSLARRGWHKLPVQTPEEFAASIEDHGLRARVAAFTRHYESARFGDSAQDASRLPELYTEIASADWK